MRTMISLLILWISSAVMAQTVPAPIIDMHVHANRADTNGPPPTAICAPGVGFPPLDPKGSWPETFTAFAKKPPCKDPVWGPAEDEELMSQTLEILKRRNIIGVASGPLIDRWREAGGQRIIPALRFRFSGTVPTPDDVRRSLIDGKYAVFAEVAIQYDGVSPSDERFDPYLAVVEELDIPMGIHIGTGPPGAPTSAAGTIARGCTARCCWRRPSSAIRNCASTSCTPDGRCSTTCWR